MSDAPPNWSLLTRLIHDGSAGLLAGGCFTSATPIYTNCDLPI